MAQYIDKAKVVAEIEKRINGLKDCHADIIEGYAGEISGLERLLSILNTLEVKELNDFIGKRLSNVMTTTIQTLKDQLQVLQEVSKTYSGKTIDNIIRQMEMRLKELEKHLSQSNYQSIC